MQPDICPRHHRLHRGAFEINLAETKRDRSMSIVDVVSLTKRALSERNRARERGREGKRRRKRQGDVGVGRPTGSRFLNFRIINLVRHRQRRSMCVYVRRARLLF